MTIDKFSENAALAQGAPYTDKGLLPFGHQLLEHFSFAPGYVNLNSGLS